MNAGSTADSGIDTNAGVGTDSFVTFTAGSTETHYVDMGDFGGNTGNAILSVYNTSSGAEYTQGTSAADTLSDGAGKDILEGLGGDDSLNGGAGADVLYGGAGADVFVFNDIGNSDTIVDFDAVDGDALDISGLLVGFDVLQDDINDFLHFTDTGSETVVTIDTDGRVNGKNFVELAVLEGNTGESV